MKRNGADMQRRDGVAGELTERAIAMGVVGVLSRATIAIDAVGGLTENRGEPRETGVVSSRDMPGDGRKKLNGQRQGEKKCAEPLFSHRAKHPQRIQSSTQ
jgi:hypothetical protein